MQNKNAAPTMLRRRYFAARKKELRAGAALK